MKKFLYFTAGILFVLAVAVEGAISRFVPNAQAASQYTQEVAKLTETCSKYYGELMQRDGRGTISIGDARAMFMLHKLGCDISGRVSGAYPQP